MVVHLWLLPGAVFDSGPRAKGCFLAEASGRQRLLPVPLDVPKAATLARGPALEKSAEELRPSSLPDLLPPSRLRRYPPAPDAEVSPTWRTRTTMANDDKLTTLAPGEAALDANLLDEAVEHINSIYVGKGLELAVAVGELVLERFFDGDPAAFADRGRKHVSFRALAKRDDLRMSFSHVWKSVAVVVQMRALPEGARDALSFSHQVLLLPVKDEKKKASLARRALEQGWRSGSSKPRFGRPGRRNGASPGRAALPCQPSPRDSAASPGPWTTPSPRLSPETCSPPTGRRTPVDCSSKSTRR